jgi:holo-[acyl-carrier protein] synthase
MTLAGGVAPEDGVVGSALELVALAEVETLLAAGAETVFSARELAYARARADPARRLAARLCAKRAALRLLGGDLPLTEIEVVRADYGPPSLGLGERARRRLAALDAERCLVSLTHERRHAAALVLLLRTAG